MPSGHAETSTLFFILLYFYKLIPLSIALLLITIFSIQRVVTNKHTTFQVIIGIILGTVYASIYKFFDLSITGFIIILIIGLILTLLTIYKIDKQVYGPIPDWVNKSMLKDIKKKQDSPLYIKIGSLYSNAYIQSVTFIDWNNLELYLDEIVDRIKKTGVYYDAVVGIKTGGAIISDYISLKLGIPNYKIKLSRVEYNCNKQSGDTIDDIVKKSLFHKQGEFFICQGIDTNLEGKNVILIDELVSTGITMKECYNYLKDEKHVNIIYPTCIGFYKYTYKSDLQINNILGQTVLVWPWGYDN